MNNDIIIQKILMHDLSIITSEFNSFKIPFLVFKGGSLVSYYNSFSLTRTFFDIDIKIDRKNLDIVKFIFSSKNFYPICEVDSINLNNQLTFRKYLLGIPIDFDIHLDFFNLDSLNFIADEIYTTCCFSFEPEHEFILLLLNHQKTLFNHSESFTQKIKRDIVVLFYSLSYEQITNLKLYILKLNLLSHLNDIIFIPELQINYKLVYSKTYDSNICAISKNKINFFSLISERQGVTKKILFLKSTFFPTKESLILKKKYKYNWLYSIIIRLFRTSSIKDIT
jgi:hypothetical protein